MAKGNMFQGMARGKVGDVVFSRLDGEQISRVRNRNPRNPKTNKQLYQRAIMATVMAAYSYGKEIFDHSFEGLEVGAANQREFMRRNAKWLRTAMAGDVNAQSASSHNAHVTAPGVSAIVGNMYVISDGTLENDFLYAKLNTQGTLVLTMPTVFQDTDTLAAFAANANIAAGDIFTICAISYNYMDDLFTVAGTTSPYASVYRSQFGWIRLKVKDVSSSSITMANAVITDLFEVEASENMNELSEFTSLKVSALSLLPAGTSGLIPGKTDTISYTNGSIGVIRSRESDDKRSPCQMALSYSKSQFGLDWQFALAGWKQGATSLGDSELILEGGDV